MVPIEQKDGTEEDRASKPDQIYPLDSTKRLHFDPPIELPSSNRTIWPVIPAGRLIVIFGNPADDADEISH